MSNVEIFGAIYITVAKLNKEVIEEETCKYIQLSIQEN